MPRVPQYGALAVKAPLHQTVHLLRHLMTRGVGLTLQALAVVAVEPSNPDRGEPDEDRDRPPFSWRRLRLITCDVVLASLEDLVESVAKATHSRRLLRASDKIGDRRPMNVFECNCCKRPEIDVLCRFSDDQVVCATCLNGVLRRADDRSSPNDQRLDRTMLETILALEVIPYWRQDPDHYRPGAERDTEAVTALMAIPQELRSRWLSAMAPVACKLVRFREIVAGMENDGRLRE